jgi:predicted metal-dependent hydrolase
MPFLTSQRLQVRLIDGRLIPLELRVSPRARRLTLRLDGTRQCLVMVHPKGVARRDLLAFAQEKQHWIAGRLDALPQPIPFADGTMLPLEGEPHRICHQPSARRGVWAEDGCLYVSGQTDFISRRVTDYLRKRADQVITPQALALAQRLDHQIGRISFRDVRSRWGSCSAKGDLSFSWRLILAPKPVLSYVVAHEVAHLRELNHSPRFWAVVADLAGDVSAERAWLKQHGRDLHYYGTP